jgi:uncharacterized OB-fold protein
MTTSIPLPSPDSVNEPFWTAALERRLVFQRCQDCHAITAPPEDFCISCLSPNRTWETSSGRGTLTSYSRVERASQPSFPTPLFAAIVRLDEGWYAFTNMIDCTEDDLAVGCPVEVAFRQMSETIALPYFTVVRT